MSLVVNTNVSAVNTQRHLEASRNMMEQAMERLSSGKRINSAMDDAAGLSITHSLDKRIVSLQMGARNANDAISLIHLAEGALQEVTTMLVRMRELATQATNATYNTDDLSAIDAEYQQLISEITRISDNTYFNGISVAGTADTLSFQVGYESDDTISLATEDMAASVIGSGAVHVSSTEVTANSAASYALNIVDAAIVQVDTYRSKLGAIGNRLDHTASNLATRIENQMAARSRIEDADYSVESAELAKNQVLQQAGTAMLAQANASTVTVLTLLKQ